MTMSYVATRPIGCVGSIGTSILVGRKHVAATLTGHCNYSDKPTNMENKDRKLKLLASVIPLNSSVLNEKLISLLEHQAKALAELKTQLAVHRDMIGSTRVSLFHGGRHLQVDAEHIVYCEASGNYCSVFLLDESELVVSKSLKYVQQLLPMASFNRCHQSFLVNKKYVSAIHGNQHIELRWKDELVVIPISRRRLANVKKEFIFSNV